jgi:hypothetical protein
MDIVYPFIDKELGELVLWISAAAGICAALFNGVAKEERWEHAAATGFWGILAVLIQSLMIIIRSIILSVFVGTITAGVIVSTFGQTPEVVVMVGVAVVAFLAEFVLKWMRENWKGIMGKILPGKDKNEG